MRTALKGKRVRLNFKTHDFQIDTVTSHDCFHRLDQGALISHRVHKWARLRAQRRGASMRPADRCEGVYEANCEKLQCLPWNFSTCVAFAALTSCLSSNDPSTDARTSRSCDINSSLCVTKLWQTALLDTQRSHKLCQQHIFPPKQTWLQNR